METRLAALEYLTDGELGDQVAEQVREKEWLAFVLGDSWFMARLTEERRDKLRRRLVSVVQIEQAIATDRSEDSEWQASDYSHVDLPTALKRIHRWWSESRHSRAPAYRRRLLPHDLAVMLEPGTSRNSLSRSSWFMLFALGSFQGMGRTQEEQHCNWV